MQLAGPAHNLSVVLRSFVIFLAFASSAVGLAQLTVTLTPSDQHGFNIGCYGGADGTIDLTVSGGTPPYTYEWSTGATTEDVADLRGGFISVVVRDALSVEAREELTLTEPNKLEAAVTPYLYPSGFNISCVSCYNGSIQVTTTDGVAPYSYAWVDGPTTEDRVQLDAGSYQVNITDANGCLLKGSPLLLTQPERDDWGKTGNAGTDPNTQFLGTTDNKDVVFKSNGAERLRLLSGGDVKVSSLSATGNKLVYVDQNGILKRANWGEEPQMSEIPWFLGGNDHVTSSTNRIGPINSKDFLLITDNVERMRISVEGKVGIGTVPPTGEVDQYRLFVEDGIVARDVLVKHGDWPDFVFAEAYRLMPLCELRAFVKAHSHLPGLPSAAELERQGGVALGTHARDLTRTVEEQALYILQLEERLVRMEQRLNVLEASKQ